MKRNIIYIQYASPAYYPPLEHSAHILAGQGWDVVFLGIRASAQDTLSLKPHDRTHAHYLSFCAAGWRQKFHYLIYCMWTLVWVLRRRPAWIYASDLFSCLPAMLARHISRAKIIYHEHDSPLRVPGATPFIKLMFWARQRLSARVKLCIIPNEERKTFFHDNVNADAKVQVAWNCPSVSEIPPLSQIKKRDGLRVYYHGTLVPARIPLRMIEALSLVPEKITLTIVGYETVGRQEYLRQLQQAATAHNVSYRVQFEKAMPRYEILRFCSQHHIGLGFIQKNTDDINLQHMIGASNKIFDYLACGLAVMVTDAPDWKKNYVETGFGVACDPENPRDIASALCWCFEHPDKVHEMGTRGREKILAEWNYEKQFAPVLSILNTQK